MHLTDAQMGQVRSWCAAGAQLAAAAWCKLQALDDSNSKRAITAAVATGNNLGLQLYDQYKGALG